MEQVFNGVENGLLQEKIDYITAKSQGGNISGPAILTRFNSTPSELKESVLSNEEFRNFLISYVINENEGRQISVSAMCARINQAVPEELKEFVLHNTKVQKSMIDYVIGAGEEKEISITAARVRLETVPESIRSIIGNSADIQAKFPNILTEQ